MWLFLSFFPLSSGFPASTQLPLCQDYSLHVIVPCLVFTQLLEGKSRTSNSIVPQLSSMSSCSLFLQKSGLFGTAFSGKCAGRYFVSCKSTWDSLNYDCESVTLQKRRNHVQLLYVYQNIQDVQSLNTDLRVIYFPDAINAFGDALSHFLWQSFLVLALRAVSDKEPV